MHGAIRNRLEDILRPGRAAVGDVELKHLSECTACEAELAAMQAQSDSLRILKGPDEVELPATFYASILRLIEERKSRSIWASLICSPFRTRLVYASLTIAALVGSYMITAEERDGHLHEATFLAQNLHYDAPVFGDQTEQRNAVLDNFASH